MALLVAPLILSLGCRGAVSVSAAVNKESFLGGSSAFCFYVLFFRLLVCVLSMLYPVAI